MFNKAKNYFKVSMESVAMTYAYMNGSDIRCFIG